METFSGAFQRATDAGGANRCQSLIDRFPPSRASLSAFACLLHLLIILIAPLCSPRRNAGASLRCSSFLPHAIWSLIVRPGSPSRVTQPLLDVLALFQQWRPKSRAVRQCFLTYLLDHVLQTHTLYWGWSQETWGAVLDALPKRRDLAADKQTRSSPHYVLLHVAAYLFSEAGPLPSNRGIPAHLMAEILFGEASVQQAIDRVLQARAAKGYTENPKGKRAFVFVLIFALLLNRNPSLEALTPTTFDTLSWCGPWHSYGSPAVAAAMRLAACHWSASASRVGPRNGG
jgi:hypothetical protein